MKGLKIYWQAFYNNSINDAEVFEIAGEHEKMIE